MIDATEDAWERGADIVLFPEYAFLNLAFNFPQPFDVGAFADAFEQQAWPFLQNAFSALDKMVVLGTVPARAAHGLVNRAWIYADGEWIFQDKLSLTPWEEHFVGGDALRIISTNGIKVAVLICLDSEMPDLAHLLKTDGSVDVVLVPSATDRSGAARVARCSYARAVELSCAVVTTSLTGSQGDESFIGSCQGRTGCYVPSQSTTKDMPYHIESDIVTDGTHVQIYDVDVDLIRRTKNVIGETNPAKLFASENIVVQKA